MNKSNKVTVFWELVRQGGHVILDTETTGLSWPAEPIEIAVIEGASQRILFDRRVRPNKEIPTSATAVHGITHDMVKDCPTFPEVLQALKESIGDAQIVCYNAEYDRQILINACQLWGIDAPDFVSRTRWSCAMTAYAAYFGDWNNYHNSYRWQSLTNACRQMGLTADNAHSALGDCISTELLIRAVLKKLELSENAE